MNQIDDMTAATAEFDELEETEIKRAIAKYVPNAPNQAIDPKFYHEKYQREIERDVARIRQAFAEAKAVWRRINSTNE